MKPKAIIVCESTRQIEYVYTKKQLEELAALTVLHPGIVNDLSQGDFSAPCVSQKLSHDQARTLLIGTYELDWQKLPIAIIRRPISTSIVA